MSSGGAGSESKIPWRGGFAELNLAFTTVCKPVIAKFGAMPAGGLGLRALANSPSLKPKQKWGHLKFIGVCSP